MDRDEIDSVIIDILHNDGPDMHIDGHDVITDFIMALLDSKGHQWASRYEQRVAIRGC